MIKNKKINKILATCFLLLLVVFPFNVFAKNNLSVNLKCPSKIEKGTTIVCYLYASSNGKSFDGMQADIILSKGVKLNSFTPNEKFSGGFNNNRLLYIGEWKSKTKVGSLNLSIDKNAKDLKIDIVDISSTNLNDFSVEKGDDYSFYYEFPNSMALVIVSLLILTPIALIVAIVILVKKKKGGSKNEKK